MSKTKDLFQEIKDPDGKPDHIGMDGSKFMIEKHGAFKNCWNVKKIMYFLLV